MSPLVTLGRTAPTQERTLVSRAQAGDVAAFEQLASAHTDRVYAVVLRLVGDRGEAEDIVQEALLRAWRAIGRFQRRATFATWLHRIAVNEANRALGKRAPASHNVPIDDEDLRLSAPPHQGPARTAERGELRRSLEAAIAELAPPYRTALVLRDIEGLSTRQAAAIAGVGEAAFKSRLHEARSRVRAAIGDAALLAAPS
jgi:RNA polymerase sigma-70 factor (ECF subfamily)